MRIEPSEVEYIDHPNRALRRMPAGRRNILLYLRIEYHDYVEAALAYGVSEERARKEVRRAIMTFRRATRPEEFTVWERLWPF
jgi:DNA-directed RNA polymerase specialized sigma24 family protein